MDNLKQAVCHLSIVPIRAMPSDKSEQVNQLLFGETFIIKEQRKQWLQIETTFDEYTGWIDEKQCIQLSKADFEKVNQYPQHYALDLMQPILNEQYYFPILIGSTLPNFNGIQCEIGKTTYTYTGQTIATNQPLLIANDLVGYAMQYLHAPYLWGGKTPFGIDCSGFTQMVFKLANIWLKRDAYQQAQQGTMILTLAQAQVGDLAFFANEENKIIHVGILLDNQQIIHASGKVRIDKIHDRGIFNVDTKKYTHKLTLIKRLLPTQQLEKKQKKNEMRFFVKLK